MAQEIKVHQPTLSRRGERAQRILDAAARLILRLGYQKVTLDDISREAKVAKATIYLHWKTRDELFLALLRREKMEMTRDIMQGVVEDQAAATLTNILRYSAQSLRRRPLMKAVFLRDMEILGRLAQIRVDDAVHRENIRSFTLYMEFLHKHKMVRTDQSVQEQIYMLAAITTGFLVIPPLLLGEHTFSDEEITELMVDAVHRTLEPVDAIPEAEAQQASEALVHYLERAIAVAETQFQAELEQFSRERDTK